VARVEGEPNDETSEDELGDEFEALLADTVDDEHDEVAGGYFTTIESLLTSPAISTSTANALVDDLTSHSLLHQLTGEILTPKPDETSIEDPYALLTEGTSRYDSRHFYGVVIDTSASKYSTAGFSQFQALQYTNINVILDETTKGQVTVQFSIGSTSSIRSARVNTPIRQVKFHIMLAKTPFLLSLADIDKLGVYFNNLSNHLMTSTGIMPVIRRFGHSFLL
jgi:hypothetical protein